MTMQKIKPSLLLYTAKRHQRCHQNSLKYGLFPHKFIQYSTRQALQRKQSLCKNGAQKFLQEIVWDVKDSPAFANGFVKKALKCSSLRKLTMSFNFDHKRFFKLQNFKIVIRKLLFHAKRIKHLQINTKWYRQGNQISWKTFRTLRNIEYFQCELSFCNPSTSEAFTNFMKNIKKRRSWPKLQKQDLFLDFKPDLFEEIPVGETPVHLLSQASELLPLLDQAIKFVPTSFHPVFSLIDQPLETDFDALGSSLQNLSDLKSFRMGNVLNYQASRLLSQVPQFKQLRGLTWYLSDYDTETSLEELIPSLVANNKFLQKLDLCIKNTSHAKFHSFTQQLCSLKSLTNLQLNLGAFHLLDDFLLNSLSNSISQLTNLTDLKIMYNKSSRAFSLTSTGLGLLLKGVESLQNLQGLFLSLRGHGKWISDEAGKMLGSTMEKLGKLEKVVLKLAANHIGEAGVVDLSLGLKKLKRLEMLELDLGMNMSISYEGVLRFCNNLKGLEWLSALNVILLAENVVFENISGGLYEMIRSLRRANELRILLVMDVDQDRKFTELIEMFGGKIQIR